MTDKNLSFWRKISNSSTTSNYLANLPQAGVKKLPENVLTERDKGYIIPNSMREFYQQVSWNTVRFTFLQFHIESGINPDVFQRNNEDKKHNIFLSKDIVMRMNERTRLTNVKNMKRGRIKKIYTYKTQNQTNWNHNDRQTQNHTAHKHSWQSQENKMAQMSKCRLVLRRKTWIIIKQECSRENLWYYTVLFLDQSRGYEDVCVLNIHQAPHYGLVL